MTAVGPSRWFIAVPKSGGYPNEGTMANKLYPKSKKQFPQAGIDLSAVNVRAILVDTEPSHLSAQAIRTLANFRMLSC
jgi:hypothetical protein